MIPNCAQNKEETSLYDARGWVISFDVLRSTRFKCILKKKDLASRKKSTREYVTREMTIQEEERVIEFSSRTTSYVNILHTTVYTIHATQSAQLSLDKVAS